MGNSIYNSKLYIDDLRTAMEHTLEKEKLCGATVMVTGASGTIGSFIVDMLCEHADGNDCGNDASGIKIIACGRNVQKLEKRFSRFVEERHSEVLDFCSLDILDDSSFANLPEENVDFIIHAAGNAYPSAFVDHYEETVKGNILGTAGLLEYGKRHGCKNFVYVSSGEVYSVDEEYREYLKKELTSAEDYCKKVLSEVQRKGPRSCYPISKVATEEMVLAQNASNKNSMETIVVRPCHTFGPGITGADDRAHVQFAKKAVAHEDIVLNSAGTQLRSYNYVADAASGIVSAMLVDCGNCTDAGGLRNMSDASRIFDICARDNEITIRGLAELIAKVSGVSVTVKEADERQKSLQSPINKQILRPEDLENVGWEKAFDLEKGVSHYLQILKEV